MTRETLLRESLQLPARQASGQAPLYYLLVRVWSEFAPPYGWDGSLPLNPYVNPVRPVVGWPDNANVFLFGIGYAACSLSCTLPIFLVVVGSALATRGLFASFGQFVGYALGMGAILVGVTVGSALFRGSVARWLRGAIPYVHRMSAFFLLGAGAYLLYYWLFYADFFF